MESKEPVAMETRSSEYISRYNILLSTPVFAPSNFFCAESGEPCAIMFDLLDDEHFKNLHIVLDTVKKE